MTMATIWVFGWVLESPMPAIAIDSDFSQPQLRRRTLRVAVLLAAVCILNGLDLVFTLFADRIDMGKDALFVELNPVADAFLRTGLIPSLICFKILMVLCGLGLLWKLRYSRLAVPACWLLLAAYICLSVRWYEWVSDVNKDLEVQTTSAVPMDP